MDNAVGPDQYVKAWEAGIGNWRADSVKKHLNNRNQIMYEVK